MADSDFKAIYDKAQRDGRVSASLHTPTPMVVGTGEGKNFKPMEVVYDGMCGFASVVIAGNTAFGRWAKKMGYARPHYPKGLSISISDYNQSYELKKRHAEVMATTLVNHGIEAYATSRLD